MKLFDIDARIMACVKIDEKRALDTETGEIVDLEAIEALEMERDTKLENIGCWYKQLLAEADAIKAEKNAMAEREKVRRNKAESLKGFLGRYLDGKKFETFGEENIAEVDKATEFGVKTHNIAAKKAKKVRYVNVVVESVKSLPQWHGFAGSQGFVFVDEISVK